MSHPPKQKHTTKPLGFSDRGPMYLTSSERWNLTRRNWQKKPQNAYSKVHRLGNFPSKIKWDRIPTDPWVRYDRAIRCFFCAENMWKDHKSYLGKNENRWFKKCQTGWDMLIAWRRVVTGFSAKKSVQRVERKIEGWTGWTVTPMYFFIVLI